MNIGELRQEVDEAAVIPAGPFQFAPHGAFARLLLHQGYLSQG